MNSFCAYTRTIELWIDASFHWLQQFSGLPLSTTVSLIKCSYSEVKFKKKLISCLKKPSTSYYKNASLCKILNMWVSWEWRRHKNHTWLLEISLCTAALFSVFNYCNCTHYTAAVEGLSLFLFQTSLFTGLITSP